MNMKTTVTITKFSDDFGDLKNMKPAGYGTNQIPEGEVPFDNGVPMQDPATQKDRDLWNRMFLALNDVPMPSPTDWGLALLLTKDPGNPDNLHIAYGYPDRVSTPRSFSITGDGEAPAIQFDGSADVVLNLTNLVAEKWKTSRTLTFEGLYATGSVSLDGSADVSANLTVHQADKWTSARTITFNGTDATGAVSLDGSANVSVALNVLNSDNAVNATNAQNAVNANHANTATSANIANTATSLANGAISVSLTGDVTGSGSIVGGSVIIPTTSTGSGGGSGAGGQTQFGNSTQIWGSGVTAGGAGVTGELTIMFPTPFVGSGAYAPVFTPEVEFNPLVSDVSYQVFITDRQANYIKIILYGIGPASAPAGNIRVNYIIVGQTQL